MEKRIAILGSTGSIGRQALDVVKKHPGQFRVTVLTAQKSAGLLIRQAVEFRPGIVVIGRQEFYNNVKNALEKYEIKVLCGEEALSEVVSIDELDIVLVALVGFAGLKPAMSALSSGKDIALANKESLVVAGELMTSLARKNNSNILPVDSEHSAIFQCLIGEDNKKIEKIILTASGGPFFGKDKNFLLNVNKHDALNHPNWDMGNKITIDSATLMNKGLEVIEAKWLFNLLPEQIEVVIHPQSIIHSLVQFCDGSLKAQLGLPDMRLPIQYALSFPDRLASDFPRFNFLNYPNLTFTKPDTENFRNLALAYSALEKGGNMPCILNAANEVIVEAFLNDKIRFFDMPEIVEQCMFSVSFIKEPSFEDYVLTNNETRRYASEIINKP